MKRMKKAMLLPVRSIALCGKHQRLYYWAENELFELRAVSVMPGWYYRWLYHACLWLVAFNNFRRLADRVIHTIPYQVRFELA